MSPKGPATPMVSHLVLNVRDLDASHEFYTTVLGFTQCADLDGKYEMRFYQGSSGNHHDLALVQVGDPNDSPDIVPWKMFPKEAGIVHIAMAYPDRESWMQQIAHMQELGIKFIERGNHGMTHSAYVADPDGNGIEVLYDLPREVWENDVNAALNHYDAVDREGPGALEDDANYPVFGKN